MTRSRPTRPSARLAALAASLADRVDFYCPTPPLPSRAELMRHVLDDRDTIGELAGAVTELRSLDAATDLTIRELREEIASLRRIVDARTAAAA